MDNATEKKYDGQVFVTSESVSMIDPDTVNTASPFKDLFQVRPTDLANVEADMKANGYDSAHPIIIWAGHNMTVIDGHTRLTAAKKLMFPQIPAIIKTFKDEAEALEYAIKTQRNRRNLTDAELLNCLTELDKRKKKGPAKSIASRDAIPGKSAEQTAALLGVSQAKIERLRAVNDHATDEVKEAVKSGKMSANKAYKATMEARHAAKRENREPEQIKPDRLLALEASYCSALTARTDRELKQYPDIRYTDDELTELAVKIIDKLKDELKRLKKDN
jgi:ParB family chromosome partitioning protein